MKNTATKLRKRDEETQMNKRIETNRWKEQQLQQEHYQQTLDST